MGISREATKPGGGGKGGSSPSEPKICPEVTPPEKFPHIFDFTIKYFFIVSNQFKINLET